AAAIITTGASQRLHPSSGVESIRGSSLYSIPLASLPDTHAIRRGQIQLLSSLHAKARIPRVHVADDVRALLRRRMRIGQQTLPKIGLTIIAPPNLRPAEIEALVGAHAIDHRGLLA